MAKFRLNRTAKKTQYAFRILMAAPAVKKIVKSKLVDLKYYNLQLETDLPNVFQAARHYLNIGAAAGINPNSAFDTRWYRETYLTSDSNLNPLLDFIDNGERLQRDPSRGFNCAFYRSFYPEIARSDLNPLRHFIQDGQFENRITSPFTESESLPSRFRNISSEILPQDGVVQFQGTFTVEPVQAHAAEILRSTYGPACCEHIDPKIRESSVARMYPAAPFIARFANLAIVGGSRLILTDAETALSDEIHAFLPVPDSSIRPHTFQLERSGKLRVLLSRQYPSRIDRGIHVMHEYAENYFHFVVEVLPKVLLADEIGLDPSLPLLVQKKLAKNLRVLLDTMNLNKRPIIELNDRQIYHVRELHFVSDASSIQDVYDRARLPEETVLHYGLVRRTVDRILEQHSNPTFEDNRPKRRIYVRRGQRYRGLRNETEVEDLLVEQGFELVSTDDLSIRSQINIFRNAELILCPTGAAVTNILWCRPGTEVNVFMSDHIATPTELWMQLGTVSGCNVTVTKCARAFSNDGKYAMHDDYFVDLDAVQKIIDRFTSRVSAA